MSQFEQELIGQLFINTSKDGKTTYLRGHVNGAKVVGFLSKKDGKSYHILADTRADEKAPAQGFKKPYSQAKSSYKRPTNEDAPF